MSEPTEVWGVAALAEKQRPAFEAHCTGDCGKISMGGIIDDAYTGGLFVCCETTCPHEEKTLYNYGTTNSFGRQHVVHLRILKELPASAALPEGGDGGEE